MPKSTLATPPADLRPKPVTPPVDIPESRAYRMKSKVLGTRSTPISWRTSAWASRQRSRCSRATPSRPRRTRPRRSSAPCSPSAARGHRAAGVPLRHADHARHDRRAGHPGVQLPPDDQGLSRPPAARTSSPRTTSACSRRRWPASRCSPTTSSPSRSRCLPASRRSTRRSACSTPVPRADRARRSSSIIAWGNLRGVKESGRMFAVPTYAVPHQRSS